MGQGQELKTRSDPHVEIQERGEIFFFYKPKVNKEEAHSPDDVQRLYIVLRPESGETELEEKQDPISGKEGSKLHIKDSNTDQHQGGGDGGGGGSGGRGSSKNKGTEGGHGSQEVNIGKQPLLRLIIMGRKSLPDPTKKRGRPYWGFVELVTTNIDDVKAALGEADYETATRGHRHVSAAVPFGEGIYRILRHNPSPSSAAGKKKQQKQHTHLIYKLEFPPQNEKNEPQESLHIEREASFLLQIKNPHHSSSSGFRGLQNKRRAVFPAHLQAEFGNLLYCPADPPDLLNYEGCEFLLISASDDIEEELGLELKTEEEGESCKSDLLLTFGDISTSTGALLKGAWV